MDNVISIFGSHNATIAISLSGEIREVIEIERFISEKNASLSFYKFDDRKEVITRSVLSYIQEKYGISTWDVCLHQRAESIYELIPAKQYIETLHHHSHAANSFYQSSFKKATIISYDGGGNDGLFNIYKGDRESGVELIDEINFDLGVPYSLLGHYMSPIRKEKDILDGNLVYPGKIMGLAAYGEVVNSWKESIRQYYLQQPRFEDYEEKCEKLIYDLEVTLVNGRMNKEDSEHLAATSQGVFEELFFELAGDAITSSSNLVVTGGCALNILLNSKIYKVQNSVYIAPNSGDCGIATGMILEHVKPTKPVLLTYSGSEIFDKKALDYYVGRYNGEKYSTKDIAKDLYSGMIIGVVRGGGEHGPRALGNRSILCNPFLENMKDVLNKKVKNREYYRPFAPVCLLNEANKYFDVFMETQYMNFAVEVRNAWRKKLSSITHNDGTCRLQTITSDQSKFIYDLLQEFKEVSGHGVLLNTSFNIAGKPILNTCVDAIWMLHNTDLDAVIIEDYIFRKLSQRHLSLLNIKNV